LNILLLLIINCRRYERQDIDMPLTVREYLEQGPATSKAIQAATGLSQRAVSRHIHNLGSSVIKIQQGRSFRYVVTQSAFGGNDNLPLVIVDTHGNTAIVAFIRPLAHGGFYVHEIPGASQLLLGEGNDGLYDDLPYFLSDAAPQGFIGRQIAAQMAVQSDDFPVDPRNWNTNHIGCYLMSNGDDLPGNFKFGNQARLRIRRKPVGTIRDDYPLLADDVMNGVIGGSSAGGEQPKFTVYSSERSAHVIVKFSPKGESEIARRWRDILITEHHATAALHKTNLPAAETELVERGERLFLESIRFDRAGEFGRSSMLSLQCIDAEFVGSGGSWPRVMNGLLSQKLISNLHYRNVKIIWAFGMLISNTDMHLGNLSLGIEGNVFSLRPVYDMCSMGFAPKSNGEVRPFTYALPTIEAAGLDEDEILQALTAARDFWRRVEKDERISDEFKRFIVANDGPLSVIK